MKIRVVGQIWYREHGWGGNSAPVYDLPGSDFWRENNFISIRNSFEENLNCAVPVNQKNVLKLQFDDAVADSAGNLILFNEEMAKQIVAFIADIDKSRELFINCAAGVSRSGAVGEVLNEYFNKYLENNAPDDYYFTLYNRQIQGNSLVRRLLRKALYENNGRG